MTPEEVFLEITAEYEFAGEKRRTVNQMKLATFLSKHMTPPTSN